MEKFDSGNFRKGQPCIRKIFWGPKICVYENYLWKKAGMNESTALSQIHTRALPVFLSRRFGTGDGGWLDPLSEWTPGPSTAIGRLDPMSIHTGSGRTI